MVRVLETWVLCPTYHLIHFSTCEVNASWTDVWLSSSCRNQTMMLTSYQSASAVW